MTCSVAAGRCFSAGLVRLHAAPDEVSLSEANAELLRTLYPEATATEWDAWQRTLDTAGAVPTPVLPAGLRRHLLLELLWSHLVDCHARLRGENPSHLTEPPLPPGLQRLTARERQVVAGVRLGQTNIAIAGALAISPKTVSKHVEHILEKLGVETRTAAVAAAYASENA